MRGYSMTKSLHVKSSVHGVRLFRTTVRKIILKTMLWADSGYQGLWALHPNKSNETGSSKGKTISHTIIDKITLLFSKKGGILYTEQ